MGIHWRRSMKKYRMLETVYVIANTISSQHNGIRGGWTMRLEIINALLIREAANQRKTMEKWIGYEEEGSLIPRGRETPDRIEGSELRDNETLTLNMTIRVLAYTGHKWIVDPNPIKVQLEWHVCTHENTWLRKVS